LQGTSSFKRNLIHNVNELKLVGQLSFVSNYKYLPGYFLRDSKKNLRFIYYPYFGIAYNKIPDLFEKGQVESVILFLARLYCDIWIVPQTIQLNFDGRYLRKLSDNERLRKNMPLLYISANFYPGKQEAISIGYEYKHGYDSDDRFQLIQVSSIRFNIKL
jgi:tRNA(His) 5'-end guanylyltransferase